jgi:glycine cleavage system transcriptional repressor
MMNLKPQRMQHILFTLIGTENDALMLTISNYCQQAGVTIKQLHHMQIQGHDCVIGHLAGQWNAMAKLEQSLQQFAQHHELVLDWQRTDTTPFPSGHIPYCAYITCAPSPDNLHKIWQFFTEQQITITACDLTEHRYQHTNTLVQQCVVNLLIPIDFSLGNIRESFMVFCDENNFDAFIEPQR